MSTCHYWAMGSRLYEGDVWHINRLLTTRLLCRYFDKPICSTAWCEGLIYIRYYILVHVGWHVEYRVS